MHRTGIYDGRAHWRLYAHLVVPWVHASQGNVQARHRYRKGARMTTPIVIDGWCTLYHADNAEIVDVLREHAPDAVITDPPYGIGQKAVLGAGESGFFRGDTKRAISRGAFAIHGDKNGADLSEWLTFPEAIFWGADHLAVKTPERRAFPRMGQTCGDAAVGWVCRC